MQSNLFYRRKNASTNLYSQSNGPNAPDFVTFLSFLPKVKNISGFLGNFCRCQSNSHENAGCSKLSDVCLIFCETQTQYCRKGTQNKPQTTMHMHRTISLPRPLSCHTRILNEKNIKGQQMVSIPYLMLVLTISFVMVVSHTCIFSFSPSLKLLMRVASLPSLLLPSIPVKSYFRNFSPLFHLPLICLGGFC